MGGWLAGWQALQTAAAALWMQSMEHEQPRSAPDPRNRPTALSAAAAAAVAAVFLAAGVHVAEIAAQKLPAADSRAAVQTVLVG